MRGSCTKFDRTKGYGFLLPNPTDDPTMPDVFVHASGLVPTQLWNRRFLLPGFNVEFDVVYDADDVGQDRPRAANVRVVAPLVIPRQASAVTR